MVDPGVTRVPVGGALPDFGGAIELLLFVIGDPEVIELVAKGILGGDGPEPADSGIEVLIRKVHASEIVGDQMRRCAGLR